MIITKSFVVTACLDTIDKQVRSKWEPLLVYTSLVLIWWPRDNFKIFCKKYLVCQSAFLEVLLRYSSRLIEFDADLISVTILLLSILPDWFNLSLDSLAIASCSLSWKSIEDLYLVTISGPCILGVVGLWLFQNISKSSSYETCKGSYLLRLLQHGLFYLNIRLNK